MIILITRKIMSQSSRHPQSQNTNKRNNNNNENNNLTIAKQLLTNIFTAALNSVKPQKIIEAKIKIHHNNNNSTLYIDNQLAATLHNRVYLIGAGKAVAGMAVAMEKQLEDRLIKGIISIPRGLKSQINQNSTADNERLQSKRIDFRENSWNNQPDNDTLQVTREIMTLAESSTAEDTLIVLISGGGSALLAMPHPAIKLEHKCQVCRNLFNSGADIREVNLIRQKLSAVKAGGLASAAAPAQVIGLILSDIIGDPIDLIASGPTVVSSQHLQELEKIIEKYHLNAQLDERLLNLLLAPESRDPATLGMRKNDQHQIDNVKNFIIGNNNLAIEHATQEARNNGFYPVVLGRGIEGNVEKISVMYAKLSELICRFALEHITANDFDAALLAPDFAELTCRSNDIVNVDDGLMLIAGGETSVVVNGDGKGGRNQELALRFAVHWYEVMQDKPALGLFDVCLLSAGTDGQDGPTDAAGAFGYAEICKSLMEMAKNSQKSNDVGTGDDDKCSCLDYKKDIVCIDDVLANNDTHNFYSWYRDGENLLKTGFTGTNVMDLHLIYIKKRKNFNFS